ncbi:MAG: N-6 DNA methylase [Thaumarchaeota archaeon]|jgi:type I restriction-modification system DNA methylase subunit|nr:N-6 DNA methylase [Nitrososphaerota archaeon]
MASRREVVVQDNLYVIIRDFVDKYKVSGVELTVEREYPIDNKRADIVVLLKERIPILIIETKRKYVERGTYKTDPRITPFSRAVIGQALCYAALVKESLGLDRTPFFATANNDGVFVFSPIDDLGAFVDIDACRDGRYEDVIKPGRYGELSNKYRFRFYRLTESEVQNMIEDIANLWANTFAIPQRRINLGNWFIEQLSSGFIETLLNPYGVGDYLRNELSRDSNYRSLLDGRAKNYGYKNGLVDIVGQNLDRVDDLARMMLYVLMNKIIFYKVLENQYRDLNQLKPFCKDVNYSTSKYLEVLNNNYFRKAVSVTQDFDPIFNTGLFDELRLPDDPEICKVIDDLVSLIDEVGAVGIGDVIGYIYEQLIPPEKRHEFGQFYTPPAVAKLIVKWSVRKPTDVVLDPGCGSGTFLLEAYSRLYELKTGKTILKDRPSKEINEVILKQLYGVDINPFPLQLSAMNLAMRNVRNPSSNMNLICKDYFTITPKFNQQPIVSSYVTVTASGMEHRQITIPKSFDAVIGNPPYTRWVEIPVDTQRAILWSLSQQFTNYNLKPAPNLGKEPGIYVYWIMHATKFLNEGGRLGMIISDMWMQTDYGIEFGKFLLDNYKIKALIDVSYRLFTALISTVIILAEKSSSEVERAQNKVLLVKVPPIDSRLGDADVERRLEEVFDYLVKAIDEGTYEFREDMLREGGKLGVRYRFIEQGQMPRDKKWIGLFFGGGDVIGRLEELANEGKLMIRANNWFEPSRGNSVWSIWAIRHGRRPDLGAKEFFYFSEGKIDEWQKVHGQFRNKIMNCLIPAITRSQWVKTFVCTRGDWEELRIGGKDVYLFICHKPRDELPSEVAEYVRWGESDECRTSIKGTRGGGRRCSEAVACRAREEGKARKWFYGWYDLGGFIPTPIMAIRQARYHSQFFLVKMPLVTYDAIITFIPKVRVNVGNWVFDPDEYKSIIDEVNNNVELDEVEVKALLAYLNSTFNWLWLEQNARYIAKGPLGLEVNIAGIMPILNVKAIDRDRVEELASLFDELEAEARRLMELNPVTNDPPGDEESKEEEEEEVGGPKLEMFRQLRPIFGKIDAKIAEVLGIEVDVSKLWDQAWEMMERRVKGAEREARPGAKPMTEEKPNEGGRHGRRKRGGDSVPITSFF